MMLAHYDRAVAAAVFEPMDAHLTRSPNGTARKPRSLPATSLPRPVSTHSVPLRFSNR